MALTGKQKRHLRGLAHHLQVVVRVGHDGLTEAIMQRIESELSDREFIKIKIGKGPLDRKAAAVEISGRTGAEVVQILGKTLMFYRAGGEDPVVELPPPTWMMEGTKGKNRHSISFAEGKVWHRRSGDNGQETTAEDPQDFIDRCATVGLEGPDRHEQIVRWLVDSGHGKRNAD